MRLEEELFKKNMRLIYNPMYYAVKPKNRGPTDFNEWLKVRGLVKRVYNPKIKDLPYFKMGSKEEAAA